MIYIKRKRSGGGPNWGAGWDDLLKDYWDDLEQIWADNLKGNHNQKLVNTTSKNIYRIIKDTAIPRMKKYNQKTGEKDDGWSCKAESILNYFDTAETTSDQVIALNTAEQFLRSTYPPAKIVDQLFNKSK
jgi:hypothetical protein